MFGKLSLALASVTIAGQAFAVEVSREVEVNAPAAEVWEAIGPFCSIADWYPGIDTCTEEMIDGAKHRTLIASDGARFLEKYMEADSKMAYDYAIIESPLPVKDYKSTLKVKEKGDNSTIVWSSTFMAEGASDDEAADIVGGIYQTGLDALKEKFAE